MGFILADELHRTNFGRTAERTCGEGVEECQDGVGFLVQLARHTAHQMDDMAVVLHVLVEIYLHTMAITAQVIAGEVDQHDVFGVFLRVFSQQFGCLAVGLGITGAACSSRYGVDVCPPALNAAMRLRTGTKNSESAKIEIEQVG